VTVPVTVAMVSLAQMRVVICKVIVTVFHLGFICHLPQ
jgi:hypothetical protein